MGLQVAPLPRDLREAEGLGGAGPPWGRVGLGFGRPPPRTLRHHGRKVLEPWPTPGSGTSEWVSDSVRPTGWISCHLKPRVLLSGVSRTGPCDPSESAGLPRRQKHGGQGGAGVSSVAYQRLLTRCLGHPTPFPRAGSPSGTGGSAQVAKGAPPCRAGSRAAHFRERRCTLARNPKVPPLFSSAFR